MINMTTTLTNTARVSARISAWRLKLPAAVTRQTQLQAHRLRAIIVKGIRDGAPGGKEFEPLAETTIDMKGSSKPLIDNGDLIRSIAPESVGQDVWFVGTNRNVQNDEGEDLANIAEIMEKGTDPYTIPVTAKLRGFWMAMVKEGVFSHPLSNATAYINHPGLKPRPYLEPSFIEWEKDFERQFSEGLAKALGVRAF